MTEPIQLERRMRVIYHSGRSGTYEAWNGWRGRVLSVDHGTTPYQFVRVALDSPYDDKWHPITWTERENLRKLPGKVE